MKLVQRGQFWWVDYREPGGKRRRISTGETDRLKAHKRAEELVKDRPRSLNDALESTYVSHWAGTKSGVIMRRVVDLLSREFAGVELKDADTRTMRAYCERWLKEGTAPATVNRRMSAVGVALSRACEDGDIASRPKLPHFRENNIKERYMSPAEETAVLEWLDREFRSWSVRGDVDRAEEWGYIRYAAIFLLDSGFRFSELFKFELADSHADLKHGTTKTDAGRRVPLTQRALVAARSLLSSPIHRQLLAMPGKAPWDWCSHRWGRATAASGCPDVTLHILRHTCASRLVQRNVPIFTVSKWLGHSSVKVTERYAKLAPDSLSMALAALEGKPTPVQKSVHGTQSLREQGQTTDLGTLREAK